jgi:hypothetical protein
MDASSNDSVTLTPECDKTGYNSELSNSSLLQLLTLDVLTRIGSLGRPTRKAHSP